MLWFVLDEIAPIQLIVEQKSIVSMCGLVARQNDNDIFKLIFNAAMRKWVFIASKREPQKSWEMLRDVVLNTVAFDYMYVWNMQQNENQNREAKIAQKIARLINT